MEAECSESVLFIPEVSVKYSESPMMVTAPCVVFPESSALVTAPCVVIPESFTKPCVIPPEGNVWFPESSGIDFAPSAPMLVAAESASAVEAVGSWVMADTLVSLVTETRVSSPIVVSMLGVRLLM